MRLSATIELAKEAHPRRPEPRPLNPELVERDDEFQRRIVEAMDKLSALMTNRG
jgi:hypothetical protein